MKKLALVAALGCSALALSGCGEDPIKTVKNSIFPSYSSGVTMGNVLDTYKSCKPKSQKWATFQTDRKQTVVSFSCEDEEFYAGMREGYDNIFKVIFQAASQFVNQMGNVDGRVQTHFDENTTLADLQAWYEKLTPHVKTTMSFIGLTPGLFDAIKAFDVKGTTFTVQFLQNLAKKDEYVVDFVGYTVKYNDGYVDDIAYNTEFLGDTAYENIGFSQYLASKFSGEALLKHFIKEYQEAVNNGI